MSYAVGIDLGTTNSCVAIRIEGEIEVIPNFDNSRTTPSYVAFTDEEELVGEAAKIQASLQPANTIYDVKRLIGRKIDDPQLISDRKNWPFKICDEDGLPMVEVTHKGEKQRRRAEEISSLILRNLMEAVNDRLGVVVRDAVITVPAYFNQDQRQKTIDAGRLAGLNVLQVINEPTAAGIAYGVQNCESDQRKTILVYDLGGGTFDVSILEICGTNFYVLSTAGDTHLGGSDFDQNLVEFFLSELKERYGEDLTNNPWIIYRLREAAENAKKTLSSSTDALVELECLVEDEDYRTRVGRAKFEDLNRDLFLGTLNVVKQALEGAKLNKSQLDEILLVGGSTRIPKLEELLREFFEDKPIKRNQNPDESIAVGAAIYAHSLVASKKNSFGEDELEMIVKIKDVLSLSLGIQKNDGTMDVIVPSNTTLPTRHSKMYATSRDNQQFFKFTIIEGEGREAKQYNKLDVLTLRDIRLGPKGTVRVRLVFEVNESGIVEVVIEDEQGEILKRSRMIRKVKRDQIDEIDNMVKEALKSSCGS
ncbi:heat shock 70kDa protein 1/2/6/8 [Paragonimus westermani]|uniref:Heat shock 70kDa protein 1/2/6/8 n=2 Tax=Paragonimus westermani TaxID=34504 RepID=A0A5J4N8D6_9TREM|nr:heat shock 70kDa protein 1/2/6/8 [Paragonimus westermani]